VRYRTVTGSELSALQGAFAGLNFAELCERLAERHGAASALPHMATLLAQWLGEGLIGWLDMA
jgi:hypothetical protein